MSTLDDNHADHDNVEDLYRDPQTVVQDIHLYFQCGETDYETVEDLIDCYANEAEWVDGVEFDSAARGVLVDLYRSRYGEEVTL
jgi:hypothetical protein